MAALKCRRVSHDIALKLSSIANKRCSSSIATQEQISDDAHYPPIKPRFPPGKWGDLSEKPAWLWHNDGEEVKQLPTVEAKMERIVPSELVRTWNFHPIATKPGMLQHQTHIMRTHVAMGHMPLHYQYMNVSEEAERLQPQVIDTLEMELDRVDRKCIKERKGSSATLKEHFGKILIKQLLQTIITSLVGMGHTHLNRAQLDEDVLVQAFWDKHGIPRKQPKSWKTPPRNDSRFQTSLNPDFQLRVEKPLPEFVAIDDPTCSSVQVEPSLYYPVQLGQTPRTMMQKVTGGHLIGDPCEFNMLTVLNIHNKELQDVYKTLGDKEGEQSTIGYGITSSFASTVAQAYSQGFNTFNDLTYPITTQTILTDGHRFRVLIYQLNTLHLWKNDEANPLKNLCWLLPEFQLFDDIEDGRIKGFNKSQLELLLKMFVIRPADRPGVDLRPYLSKEVPAPLEYSEYIKPAEKTTTTSSFIVYDQTT